MKKPSDKQMLDWLDKRPWPFEAQKWLRLPSCGKKREAWRLSDDGEKHLDIPFYDSLREAIAEAMRSEK